MSIELIARLNPKIQQYVMGRGGVSELTWEMIAGAITGLSQYHSILINILRESAYPQEFTEIKKWLVSKILNRMADMNDHCRKMSNYELAMGVSTIALYCYLKPRIECYECLGLGVVKHQKNKLENCTCCKATGWVAYTIKAKLNMAGWQKNYSEVGAIQPLMNEKSYLMKWDSYEKFALSLLQQLESEISERIKDSLFSNHY